MKIEAIEEFRAIYRDQYGIELSYTEAMEQANNLIRLYKAVLRPLKTDNSQNQKMSLKNIT
jgi:hypothetical protein